MSNLDNRFEHGLAAEPLHLHVLRSIGVEAVAIPQSLDSSKNYQDPGQPGRHIKIPDDRLFNIPHAQFADEIKCLSIYRGPLDEDCFILSVGQMYALERFQARFDVGVIFSIYTRDAQNGPVPGSLHQMLLEDALNWFRRECDRYTFRRNGRLLLLVPLVEFEKGTALIEGILRGSEAA